jgi:hypothetical protein
MENSFFCASFVVSHYPSGAQRNGEARQVEEGGKGRRKKSLTQSFKSNMLIASWQFLIKVMVNERP